MRISTVTIQSHSINAITDLEAQMVRIQQQLATGKSILRASDDPIGSQSIVRLNQEVSLQQRYMDNRNTVQDNLGVEDNAVTEYTNIIQNVRSLTLQAANSGTLSMSDRQTIATQMQQQLDALASIANTKNADGQYLFAGFQTAQKTYTQDASGHYVCNADQGQRYVAVGSSTQIAVSDSATVLFEQIPAVSGSFATTSAATNSGTGVINLGQVTDLPTWQAAVAANHRYALTIDPSGISYSVTDETGAAVSGLSNVPYVSGQKITVEGVTFTISGNPRPSDTFSLKPAPQQSIFKTIQNLVVALNTETDPTRYAFATDSALTNFDNAAQVASNIRTQIGSRLNIADQQYKLNSDFQASAQKLLASIQDVDFPKAVSEVTAMSTALDAAQRTYQRVSSLSLFRYLQ